MRHNFSNVEYRDMMFEYGAAHGNALAAREAYIALYPARIPPTRKVFQNVYNRLGETGQLQVLFQKLIFLDLFLSVVCESAHAQCPNPQPLAHPERGRRVQVAVGEDVLQRVAQNPRTSTRAVASQVDCSGSTVHRILRRNNLHPFKLQKVHELRDGDAERRLEFCTLATQEQQARPNFLNSVLVSDEKGFSREGTFNHHNNHFYAEENPHLPHVRGYQTKFSVNVWCGILGDHLLGPYILPERLNAQRYLVFLQEVLPELLEEADPPVDLLVNHWFQHDGCPAHFGRDVRAYLDAAYPDRWIGRGGPVAWPARSPDLTPPDFFLWGTMEAQVYATPVESREDLVARVVMAGEQVRQDPGVFARVRADWLSRMERCIANNGSHVEL